MTATATNAVFLHAAGSLAASFLVFTLYRQFRVDYALRWTLSFASLALFEIASAFIILRSADSPRGFLVVAAIAGGAAAYLQLGLMIWGSFEVARRKPLKIRESQRLMSSVAVTGVLAGTIPYLLGNDVAIHRFFPVALHALAASLVFAACGVALLKFRGKGFALQALAFAAYGFAQFAEFSIVMRSLMNRTIPLSLTTLSVIELVASAVIALGVVLVLLEDQREAAATATSEVERLAYYDTITGLPNRALFADRLRVALTHAQRHRYKVGVIFLDLDRFKQVNDSLGHTMGDKLLKAVATRIRNTVREEDTVARFGGDEFAVLIHILGKIEDAGKIARKILDALAVPVIVDNREFGVSGSIGLAVYPVDGPDGETLIRNADAAMHRAKELGANNYQYYAVAMNHRAVEALEIDSGLRRALVNKEFVLHYQPLVDVASGTVFGLEALIRWQHPELGLLGPDRFIPAAEQSGLIIEIGRWVLHEACKQARDWHQRGHRVVMAVNLSARQFQDPELPAQVADALSSADLAPRFLELEITEGYAMQDVEKAIETLHELKALGVRIAIDDFGTGYSCFSYLKRFPIDTLKLDQSFVRDLSQPEDAQIALGVIALAHSLKLKVIAEGVETIGQLAFLRDHECDRLQGYLFSRPIPPAQFESLMTQKHLFRVATTVH
jgi:diguanylate cyclase (GGDEF)-like protein